MATLQIRKKSAKVWEHVPSDANRFIISKLYAKTDADNFKIVEDSGSNRKEYDYTNITVYDDTTAGTPETFASAELLMLRLEELSYVGFNRDGEVPTFDPSDYDLDQFSNLNADPFARISDISGGAVVSVNTQTGIVVLTQDNIGDGTTYKQYSATEKSKLAAITGTNTGDNAVNSLYSGLVSNATHTGDATGATALTLATVNSNIGAFGSASKSLSVTVNGKGLVTAMSEQNIAITESQVTNLTTDLAAKLPIAAGATTGVSVSFVTDRVYGTIASPETGNITSNLTGAQLGVTNIIIHNHSSAPTFGSEFKKLSGSGSYVISSINYIYCTYINSTEIVYSINQRT